MFPASERLSIEHAGPVGAGRTEESAMFRPRTKTLTATLVASLTIAAPGIARAGKLTSGFLISSNATRMGCIAATEMR